jgi:DNA-binding response OmpR family regulator
MKRLLVVDDEAKIRLVIKKYAMFEGYEVAEAGDGMEAIELCKKEDFDLIILDVMMPELDGFSTCKEIKKLKDIPVIMLSARGEEYDKIHGFELGIDDYVVKPFSPKELMMRVNVVLSRHELILQSQSKVEEENTHDIYEREGLLIDFTGRIVSIDGKNAEMTPKEYELLFYMVKNKGIALTREQLITQVWGYDYYGDDRTLDTHIKLLRSSLGKYRKFLVTLRGVGYRFEA